MSLNSHTLRQLPGVDHHLFQLMQQLARGCSVLSIVPKNIPIDHIQKLGVEMFWQGGLDVEELDLSQVQEPKSPSSILLQQYFQEKAGAKSDSENLQVLASCSLPEIIILHGIDDLPLDEKQAWVGFFQAWATHTNAIVSRPGHKQTSLWGILTPDNPKISIPLDDTWLQIQSWWSSLSGLDIRLFCRLTEGFGQTELSPTLVWKEALIPFLAGNDLGLIAQLWHVLDLPKDQIYNTLLQVAKERGWTAAKLERWGISRYLRKSTRHFLAEPTKKERSLWLQGVLFQMPEYGLLVSSVALAVLQKWEQLDHLLWRGQAALLLPLIDEYRISICQNLTDDYGPDWAWQWSNPIAHETKLTLINNPFSAEWGHLENSIRKSPYRREKIRLKSVKQFRRIRNKLAHYQPVTYFEYESLLSELG